MLKQSQETTKKCNILLICSLQDSDSLSLIRDARDILAQDPRINIYTENIEYFKETILYDWQKPEAKIDYTICIGSNQQLMQAIQRIINNPRVTSPIVTISNGKEPLLSSFSFCDLEKVIRNLMRAIKKNKVKYKEILTMDIVSRQNKKIIKSFTGELEIHRGMNQSVVKLNLYVRTEEKDFMLLAPLWGDGIIISTPFGSTGSSMALSGPIIHKNLECIMIVPVCPLSLNFRPIILPASTQILIEVDKSSRAPAKIFVDGEQLQDIAQQQRIIIRKGSKNTKMVSGLIQISSSQSWIMNLHNVINWAQHFGAKSPPPILIPSESEKFIIKEETSQQI